MLRRDVRCGRGCERSGRKPVEQCLRALRGADRGRCRRVDGRTRGPLGGAEPEASPETTEAVAQPQAAGAVANLAETGGDSGTPYLAVGGAGALALGVAALLLSVRRRAVGGGGRHGH